jgi:hypothetical protein
MALDFCTAPLEFLEPVAGLSMDGVAIGANLAVHAVAD